MPLSGHSSITLHTNIVTLLKSGDYKGALKLVDEGEAAMRLCSTALFTADTLLWALAAALPLEQENDTLCQLKDTLLQKLHLQEGMHVPTAAPCSMQTQQQPTTPWCWFCRR
jgi:hypothetical protein